VPGSAPSGRRETGPSIDCAAIRLNTRHQTETRETETRETETRETETREIGIRVVGEGGIVAAGRWGSPRVRCGCGSPR
jgi:hypothetical protein